MLRLSLWRSWGLVEFVFCFCRRRSRHTAFNSPLLIAPLSKPLAYNMFSMLIKLGPMARASMGFHAFHMSRGEVFTLFIARNV